MQMAALAGAKAGDVIAFGHTHLAWHREVDGIYFINTGTVGRPKDGDARAGYSVVEIGAGKVNVEHRRLDYDVERAMRGIRESDLPDDFAEFLRTANRP
jgi:predicted phosphodiesterase